MIKKKRGFTLVELVVAMGLASLIFVASIFVLQLVSRVGSKSGIAEDAQQLARTKLDFLEAELRFASELEITNSPPGQLNGDYVCLYVKDGKLWRDDRSYSGPFSDDGGITGYTYTLSFSAVNDKVVQAKLAVYSDSERLYDTDVSFFVSNLNDNNISGLSQGNYVIYRNTQRMVESVVVTASSAFITVKRQTLQMKATVFPPNATNRGVAWSVDNTNIATISQDGVLTPIRNGIVTVTGTTVDGTNKSGSKTITISNQPQLVERVTLYADPISYVLHNGGERQIVATVYPATAENKRLVWSVDDPSLASISQNGLLKAKEINATSKSVVVRATTQDGSNIVATIQITIVKIW
ncbi:MAG: Ig-like domain-containing protein [Oscillospiraceae bacterium]|jgi:prepilin-type N-terminal cleavage/methylation domain-containing protein|nr:Ig-like domain-containing protein [Oscillospiraceae bacterium]